MAYRLADWHPLQPLRVKLTVETIERLGLIEHAELLPPRRASDDEIALVHAREYIDLVRLLAEPAGELDVPFSEQLAHGFGTRDNPVAEGMHDACAYVVGGSLVAAEAVHHGRALHAFNPAGGLHHARRARAHGFCVYNDVAVAAEWLRRQGHRVAVVDVDVHHGDGTEQLFWEQPDVLTISLHESGRYLFPGTGFPADSGGAGAPLSAANLPFLPEAWDEPWLHGLQQVVEPLLRRFRPTVLVTQDGCDTHLLDPLAHLRNSTRIWPAVGGFFHRLAHELCDGRWVALGGGGYAVKEVVPRAWTLLFAEMVERPELAAELLDPSTFEPDAETQRAVWGFLERDLRQLREAQGLD
jgi:acetoin utilization protein AcuC